MSRNSACLLAALALATLGFGGCNHQRKTQLAITNLPTDYSAVSTVDVNISSASGTIELIAQPRLKAPWIDVKRARPRLGGMSGPGKHPEQYATATFSEDHGRGTLTIVSSAGDVASSGEWVRILVHVPSLNDVRIRNAGGHVLVQNARGAIDIQNSTTSLGVGSIDFTTTFPMKGSFQLSTDEGPITARMAADSDLQIEAFAGGGAPTFNAAKTSVTGILQRGESWTGTVNGGAGHAIIRSGKGTVKLNIGTAD